MPVSMCAGYWSKCCVSGVGVTGAEAFVCVFSKTEQVGHEVAGWTSPATHSCRPPVWEATGPGPGGGGVGGNEGVTGGKLAVQGAAVGTRAWADLARGLVTVTEHTEAAPWPQAVSAARRLPLTSLSWRVSV